MKPRRIPIDILAASDVQQLEPRAAQSCYSRGLRMAEFQEMARVSLAACGYAAGSVVSA